MGNTYLLFTFVISLGVIIALILSKKLNPSLCLFIGAIVAAVIGRVDFSSIAGIFNQSFGSILVSTGILMVFAFTFSQYLNESGGVTEFAKFMVRIVGDKYDLIAMAIVGYVLSIPVGLLASCAIVIPMFRPMSRLTGRPVAAYLAAMMHTQSFDETLRLALTEGSLCLSDPSATGGLKPFSELTDVLELL